MKVIDILSEAAPTPAPTEEKPTGPQWDKDGNYIKGSYLRSMGIDPGIIYDWGKEDNKKPGTTSDTVSSNPANPGNGVPKGATEDQMKRFGPSVMTKINWHDMRDYIARKLSFNHAVAMVVNCKWESGFIPGRWVHSDASQGPSGGLFMFHDANFNGTGFFSSMVQACGGPGKWQSNWQAQIDFALSSGIGQGPKFAAMKFRNPAEATHWFCYNFERPRDRESQATKRAQEAHLYSK